MSAVWTSYVVAGSLRIWCTNIIYHISHLDSEVFTIVVGPEKKRFQIHQHFAKQRSPYLNHLLSSSNNVFGVPPEDVVLVWDDYSEAGFEVIAEYLYLGLLSAARVDVKSTKDSWDLAFVEACVQAEKHCMWDLTNDITDRLKLAWHHRRPTLASFRALQYDHLPDCKAEQLLVDSIVWWLKRSGTPIDCDEGVKLVLQEEGRLVEKLKQAYDQKHDLIPTQQDICAYHLHENISRPPNCTPEAVAGRQWMLETAVGIHQLE